MHTFLSGGSSHPMEIAHRAALAGHRAIAATDHAGLTDAERMLSRLTKECEAASKAWDMLVIPGVELTYVPPPKIAAAARAARRAGAEVVVALA